MDTRHRYARGREIDRQHRNDWAKCDEIPKRRYSILTIQSLPSFSSRQKYLLCCVYADSLLMNLITCHSRTFTQLGKGFPRRPGSGQEKSAQLLGKDSLGSTARYAPLFQGFVPASNFLLRMPECFCRELYLDPPFSHHSRVTDMIYQIEEFASRVSSRSKTGENCRVSQLTSWLSVISFTTVGFPSEGEERRQIWFIEHHVRRSSLSTKKSPMMKFFFIALIPQTKPIASLSHIMPFPDPYTPDRVNTDAGRRPRWSKPEAGSRRHYCHPTSWPHGGRL